VPDKLKIEDLKGYEAQALLASIDSTRLWVSVTDDNVIYKIEDLTKGVIVDAARTLEEAVAKFNKIHREIEARKRAGR